MMALVLLASSMPPVAWADGKDLRGQVRAKIDEPVRQEVARRPQAEIPILIERKSQTAASGVVQTHGGRIKQQLKTRNTIAAEVPAGKLEELARDPGVTRITLDAPMRSLDEKRDRERNEQRDRDDDRDDRQKQARATPRAQGQRARASEPAAEPNPHCRPPAGRGSPKDAKPETGAPDVRRLGTVYPLAVCAADLWAGKQGIRGDHVTVAVLDSGIDLEHQDFNDVTLGTVQGSSRVLERLTKSTGRQGEDDNGHGTFVAGIIAGRGFGDPTRLEDDGRYVGIAPDVDVVSVKVSDGQGVARVSQVIDAIEWAVENRDRHNIRVISLALVSSVPESYKTSLLSAAVQLAWFKGIVVVVAAGNDGPGSMLYPPANDPYVITVGATDDMGTVPIADDRLAWFSSHGRTQDGVAKPDLVAPGRRIVSTLSGRDDRLARQFPDRIVDRRYIRLSGTSASAPIVTGVVAQILQARPKLTPDEVKWLLLRTAQSVPGEGTGAGYPNAVAAVHYTGAVGKANGDLLPNVYVAMAGYAATARTKDIDWGRVNWAAVNWRALNWDKVTWDESAWSTSSWSTSSWSTSSWSTSSWSTSSWSTSSWSTSSWSTVAGD